MDKVKTLLRDYYKNGKHVDIVQHWGLIICDLLKCVEKITFELYQT